ncbi:hypothetical protein KJ765_03410 [Candidatus Micrarchaeota archaeon]|nr:hypothetical protein [Candidatus Micrarchaeota archaeon]
MPLKHKTSAFLNVFLVVVLVIVFGYFAYSLYTAPQQLVERIPVATESVQEMRLEQLPKLDEKYASKTISYYDPDYGYRIRYPVGYSIQLEPAFTIRLRIAAFYPPFSSEIMDLRILRPDELTPQLIRASATSEGVVLTEYEQRGRKLYMTTIENDELAVDGQTIFVREAFYECPSYWIVFTAAISEPLAPDLELADYMISTLECG